MSELIWKPSSVLPARGQKVLAVFGEKESVMAGFFSNDARNFDCSLGQISWQTVRCWAAWPEVPPNTNPVRDDIAPKIANHYPEWISFGDSEPFVGYKILVAWIKCGVVEEAIGPFTYLSRTHFDARFTHWCPASVLPPVPAKRDYCREAWEKLPLWDNPITEPSQFNFRRMDLEGGSIAVTLPFFRNCWNAAIACAKENGLEKV